MRPDAITVDATTTMFGPGASLPALRVALTYLWRHRRLPNLAEPQSFTERVQHRKLHDRDVSLPILADKVRVKAIVADQIGADWVIPTLWHGAVLPETRRWPAPFVIKARHGCNRTAFILDDRADWRPIRRKAARWTASPYGGWLDEWLYRHIPRGLLVEPFIGHPPDLPIDYKFYVFGGRVAFVQVHLGRGQHHRWIIFDRDWCRVSARTHDPDPPRPRAIDTMITAAETLGRRFDFVRVDLYENGGRPLFGEMTFYPGSGLDPFRPISLDHVMGEYWRDARLAARAADAGCGAIAIPA